MENKTKVLIIGSGPSGLTAAIYCARAMLEPVLMTGNLKGGQLMNTTEVENFPGYPDSVEGPELINQLEFQAVKFGTKLLDGHVLNIDTSSKPFKVDYTNMIGQNIIFADSIIIATGSYPLWLNAKNEDVLKNKGISSCAVCDGAFFKQLECVVIGGGDQAMEDAIFLTKYATKVTIITRRDKLRASKIMIERTEQNKKIEWLKGFNVIEWKIENERLGGAILKSTTDDEIKEIPCQGAFIAIGHKPSTDFVKYTEISIDKEGYIITENGTTNTTVKGIFASGDVTVSNKRYKQAITASGEGCAAALDCEKFLESI